MKTSEHLRTNFKTFIFAILFLVMAPATLVIAGGHESAEDVQFSELAMAGEPLYLHYCAHCHGVSGEGDGFNAENLEKDPAELSDNAFVSKRSNEKLFKVISEGGRAAKKSYLMPVFGRTLSEKEIWSLVAYIRLLAEDKEHPVSLPPNTKKERPNIPPETGESLRSFIDWFKREGSSNELVKKGESLFRDKLACIACHSISDEGGRVGPELTRAHYLYKPEWLYVWIKNPQHAKPKTRMPNLGVSEKQARALVAFLQNLRGIDEAGEDEDEEGGEQVTNNEPSEGLKQIVLEEWKPFLESEGDVAAGKALFFDLEGTANCAKCHSVKGDGGKVGPDLSLVGTSRTKEFLLESILNPKAVITVGYASVLILTKEGKFLTGIKINEDDQSLDIVDKDGKSLHVEKSLIKKFKMQKISIMPGNFKDILSKEEIQNLLAYLTSLTLPQLQ